MRLYLRFFVVYISPFLQNTDDFIVSKTPVSPQVDGLHPDHFETPRRNLTSGSSSLERELCPPTETTDTTDADAPLLDVSQIVDITPPADLRADLRAELRAELRADLPETSVNGLRKEMDTPEEPPVFVCDTYTDVIAMEEVRCLSSFWGFGLLTFL